MFYVLLGLKLKSKTHAEEDGCEVCIWHHFHALSCVLFSCQFTLFFFFLFHFGDGSCTFHFLLGLLWYDLIVSWGLNVKTKQNQGSFRASFFSPIFLKQVGGGDSSVAERQTHDRKVLDSRSGWRIFFFRVN